MQKVWVEKNKYRDSVTLMHITDQIVKNTGVEDIAVLMGTPSNIERMKKTGFNDPILSQVGPGDLCIGIRTENREKLEAAEGIITDFLKGKTQLANSKTIRRTVKPKTLSAAKRTYSNANLAVISTPGEYAGAEARFALEQGMHVFLFSDNVSLNEEKSLKYLAQEKGLLMMGPDCGTAYIQGIPLGFCNQLERGNVGIVAASGTGAQEISSILGLNNIGISHILGTGGRDLSKEIGGITSNVALQLLNHDPDTNLIIFVSKPPSKEVEKSILQTVESLDKPVIICFIGGLREKSIPKKNVYYADSLFHAANLAISLIESDKQTELLTYHSFIERNRATLEKIRSKQNPDQKFIRGIYSGGTLADETAVILSEKFSEVYAGDGFGKVLPINDWTKSNGHLIIDMGDDRFTKGRPHPMIDPTIRLERLQQESQDPLVSAILIDVILGYNADPDPASKFAPIIRKSLDQANKSKNPIAMVVHICGTHRDPQNLEQQIGRFEEIGCLVYTSNMEAALAASFFGRDS